MPAPRSPPVPLIDAWNIVTVYAPRSPTFHSSLTSLIHAHDAQDALLLRMDDTRYLKRDNWSKHHTQLLQLTSSPGSVSPGKWPAPKCTTKRWLALDGQGHRVQLVEVSPSAPLARRPPLPVLRDSSPRPPTVQWLIQWLIQESKNSNMLFQPGGSHVLSPSPLLWAPQALASNKGHPPSQGSQERHGAGGGERTATAKATRGAGGTTREGTLTK
ncbi:hypothetical protein CPAR01_02857 [Colletotrichum paranaense]|uniref:Uncharacterized protein n=1 Tax=Colletotrichum paranaense TaxID=1914294 RepID=A0ABQ9T0Q3_9PEZI|nr:uncharacterized protein CPAR01_02857 [Colletotrichum paranaense]KAK1545355.1 hypothetical protein CPAR01_02857 [Colletotrichum paranaense]